MAAPDLAAVSHLQDPAFQETWQEAYDTFYSSVPDNNILSAAIPGAKKYTLGEDGSVIFSVQLSTGGSGATLKDGAKNPRPGKPVNKKGKTKLVWHYDSFELGGQRMALNGRSASFVDDLEDNYNALLKRTADDMERQANGDGRGILCVIKTIVGAPTYGVEKPYGKAVGAGTMLLKEEMNVAIVSPAGVVRGTTTIETYDHSNETMECAGAVAGVQIGDFVVRTNGASGSDLQHSLDAEANGIMQFTSNGDVCMGIDGAEHRRWNAVRMQNDASPGTGRKVTEAMVSSLARRVKVNTGAMQTTTPFHYTTDQIALDLAEEIAGRLRTAGSTKVQKGGFEYVEINGTQIATSPIAPRGQYRILNFAKNVIGKLELSGHPGFLGYGRGKAALRFREDYNTVYSVFERPHNVILHQRNCHGELVDLTDDKGYTDN